MSVPASADDGLNIEGTGEAAWGCKFVIVATRDLDVNSRIILDTAFVATSGGEAAQAVEMFTRLRPHLPGAQAVIYDTALRGVHHQQVMRHLGLTRRLTHTEAGTDVAGPRPDTPNDRPSGMGSTGDDPGTTGYAHSPVTDPTTLGVFSHVFNRSRPSSSMAEQWTFNPLVQGSSPWGGTDLDLLGR